MLKYANAVIGLVEVPDEISLCINISGCRLRCKGCHSPWLWENEGTSLTNGELHRLIQENEGVSCICFMGGDHDPEWINILAGISKSLGLKSAWYSGKTEISHDISLDNFDYIKVGPYIEEFGGLDKSTTNQKMYKINHYNENSLEDITKVFLKS